MDLLAALALVLVIEGLALAIMARSLPELIASIGEIPPGTLRVMGFALVVSGAALYLLIRSA
ncbi:MAG: DUF2065 family protein [Pseudomonadota bacterium]